MGQGTGRFRRRIKLGRILLSLLADTSGKKYKELDTDGKVVRLLNEAYKMMSGGTEYNKAEFQQEWNEVSKYF